MTIRWLPPLFVNAAGTPLEAGVDTDARWFIRAGGASFPAEEDWRPLLPLLQPGYGGSWEEVRDRVVAGLAAAGVDPALVDTFPFELPVLGADVSGSSWWLDRAEPWRPHVGDRYAATGLRIQFERMYRGSPGSLPLPPTPAGRSQVFEAVWRSFRVEGHKPAWSSGLVDAAVRWSLGAGPGGPRQLWVALLTVLRYVEPNILHWNLFDALWIAGHATGLHADLAARPPGEACGPLGVAQALLVLRFLPLEGDLGDRVRRTLAGVVLPDEVDGRRYCARLSPADLLC